MFKIPAGQTFNVFQTWQKKIFFIYSFKIKSFNYIIVKVHCGSYSQLSYISIVHIPFFCCSGIQLFIHQSHYLNIFFVHLFVVQVPNFFLNTEWLIFFHSVLIHFFNYPNAWIVHYLTGTFSIRGLLVYGFARSRLYTTTVSREF